MSLAGARGSLVVAGFIAAVACRGDEHASSLSEFGGRFRWLGGQKRVRLVRVLANWERRRGSWHGYARTEAYERGG